MNRQREDLPSWDEEDINKSIAELNERSNVVQLFSKPSVVRILNSLMHKAGGVPPGMITAQAGVCSQSWYSNKEMLLEMGLVEQVGEDRGVPYYAMTDNEVSNTFRELVYRLDGADILAEIEVEKRCAAVEA